MIIILLTSIAKNYIKHTNYLVVYRNLTELLIKNQLFCRQLFCLFRENLTHDSLVKN